MSPSKVIEIIGNRKHDPKYKFRRAIAALALAGLGVGGAQLGSSVWHGIKTNRQGAHELNALSQWNVIDKEHGGEVDGIPVVNVKVQPDETTPIQVAIDLRASHPYDVGEQFAAQVGGVMHVGDTVVVAKNQIPPGDH